MDAIENDIGTALMRLRTAFARHNIPCPDVLEFSEVEKGRKALIPLRHAIGPASWVMDSGAKPYGEVCLAGFTLRFEPRVIERPGTGAELDDEITGRVFYDPQR